MNSQSMATRLTHRLFSMLKPGGRLLIANFTPSASGRGYMEAFMDWRLIYRSPDELLALFPEHVRTQAKLSTDPHQNVAYAIVERQAASN